MTNDAYTAASGLIQAARTLDVTANNLANVDTGGFRARRLFSESLNAARDAAVPARIGGDYELPGPGNLRRTDRPLDIALQADALLVIETDAGRRYSRAGSLSLSDGTLTHGSGNPVLGPDGFPIDGLQEGTRILGDGSLVAADGSPIGELLVVRADADQLVPIGGGLFASAPGTPAPAATDEMEVRPGWLEGSTTTAVDELVRLIDAQRAFDRLQKLVAGAMNDVNRRAVNEIAAS